MNTEKNDIEKKIYVKKTSVILTIIFSIITGGIYCPCWFLTRREQINHLESEKKLGKTAFIVLIVFLAMSLFLAYFSGMLEGIGTETENIDFIVLSGGVDLLCSIFQIVSFLILLIQSFKLRRIMLNHFKENFKKDFSISVVLTFVFQIYYLQYKINRLE